MFVWGTIPKDTWSKYFESLQTEVFINLWSSEAWQYDFVEFSGENMHYGKSAVSYVFFLK